MRRILILCALMLPGIAAADGDQWYVNPQIGGISPAFERDLKNNDWIYGIGVGRELGPVINLELNANGARINNRTGGGHLNEFGYSLDVLAVLNRNGMVSPYLIVGGGALRDNPDPGQARTDSMAEAGVGAMWHLWRNASDTSGFALRPEIKARWDDPGHSEHLVDYIAMLGFQFSFGGTAPVHAAAPPAAPVVVAAAPPPPPPAPPLDSDHDGVPDNIDQCPNTPPGVQVDAVGCPIKGSITLEGVNFEYNSAALTAESRPTLDTVAAGLKNHPRVKVEVQGHTDSKGTPAYNLHLSQRRADSVRDYLISQGVDSGQLIAKGFGQSQPIASNKTESGRAQNRRVVMLVLSNPGDVKVQGAETTPLTN